MALKKQMVVLLFFAGHGLSADDKNYLLGIEMEDSIVTTASGVKRNGTKPDAEGSERVPGTGWIAAELVYMHIGLLVGCYWICLSSGGNSNA